MSDRIELVPGRQRRRFRSFVVGSLFSLVALAQPVAAEMYKWVDESGNVHYTQERPPAGIKGETIKPPPPVDSEAARKQLESRQELLQESGEARSKSAEESRLAAEDRAFKAENCRRARASVSAYSVPNALVMQPDGSRSRFSEDERRKGLADAEARVQEFCN